MHSCNSLLRLDIKTIRALAEDFNGLINLLARFLLIYALKIENSFLNKLSNCP